MVGSPPWGPSGETVYERTYQREKQNGKRETWEETVRRVVTGNLSLVYGDPSAWSVSVREEAEDLGELMHEFKVLPAGRHLWASGVPGRQYLFNCHVSGWTPRFSDHFEFTFMRLMEGGGVGANYSSVYTGEYQTRRKLKVHIVCDPSHPDYQKMKDAGVLSESFSSEWSGAFEIADSREGWAAGLVDLLDTFTTKDEVKHKDRVYDVTNVRPEGARLKTFGGRASGPLPFAQMMLKVAEILNAAKRPNPLACMEIDHAIATCVVAGGNRRSARMAMVRWDDPDVFDFINCKAEGDHWSTNISVEIDDEFTELIGLSPLEAEAWGSEGEQARYQQAVDVHNAVVAGMLRNGEPGYWNSSLSNHGEIEQVVCTNPCGEIALTAWENCNLGHVNMDAFAEDYEGMVRAHELMTRFLIRATYGDVTDPKQAKRLDRQRRIGVGHFGVQGFLVKNGTRYSEAPTHNGFRHLLNLLQKTCRQTARDYAFELRIPEPVKVTTVAPTGTIAKLAGRTEGIHPIFARYFIRRIRFSEVDPDQWAKVTEYAAQGYKVERDVKAPGTWVVEFPTKETLVAEVEALGYDAEIVESADELTLEQMLAFQAMYQKEYADNAVSFTVNFKPENYETSMVAGVLANYLPVLKGTTLMPEGSYEQAPYERITKEQYDAAQLKTVADGVDEDCTTGACPVR